MISIFKCYCICKNLIIIELSCIVIGVSRMYEDFLVRAETKCNDYLLKTEELFVTNKSLLFANFYWHLYHVCTQIRAWQGDSVVSSVSYLEYVMLYSNFINRHYVADVFIFDDRRYLDTGQKFVGSYDISALFIYFDMLWNDLLKLKKLYVGKVTSRDVAAFMMASLPDFYSYLSIVARYSIAGFVEEKLFKDILKNNRFMVNIGDYMASTVNVHIEEKVKDAEKLIECFNDKEANKYACCDYSGLCFSECNFSDGDFRNANFSGADFSCASLRDSTLDRAIFRNANMDYCNLDNCSILESDFSYTSLKNASFVNVEARAGLVDKEEWHFAGYLSVNFRNSDLSGADFTNADLTGADFSGAILIDTLFTDTVLDNAVFSDRSAPLSALQKKSVIIQETVNFADFDKLRKSSLEIPNTDKKITISAESSTSQPRHSPYYVLEQLDNTPSIPPPKTTEVQRITGIKEINACDYFSRYGLISAKLKKLFEMYMPGYHFELAAYIDTLKPDVTALWIFKPKTYFNFQATYRNDGNISHITTPNVDTPRIFAIKSPKGVRSIIVHIAVAESILRRNIFGLKLTRLLECEQSYHV